MSGHDADGRDSVTQLDPERTELLESYLAGEMDDQAGSAFLERVVHDPKLARALYEVRAFEEVFDQAREVWPGPRRRRVSRRVGLILVPALAIAATVATLAVVRTFDPGSVTQPPLRGGVEEFRGLGPSGPVALDDVVFTWTEDPEAASYRLEIVDDQGQVVFSLETTQSTATVTSSRLTSLQNQALRWHVVPRNARGLLRPPTPDLPLVIQP